MVPIHSAPEGWTRPSLERVTGLSASSGVCRDRRPVGVSRIYSPFSAAIICLSPSITASALAITGSGCAVASAASPRFSSSIRPSMSNQKAVSVAGS